MRRRSLLAAAAVAVAPAVQVVPMFLHPVVEEGEGGFVAAVTGNPAQWQWIHLGAAVAAMLYVVALPALATVPRSRGSALATVGAVLGVVGSMALAVAFAGEAFVLPLAIDAGVAAEGLHRISETAESGVAETMLLVGLPAAGIGQLLLAGGLLRAGEVRRWKPALVLAGLLGSLFAPPGTVAGPLLMLLAVVGYVALAGDVARAPRGAVSPSRSEHSSVPVEIAL